MLVLDLIILIPRCLIVAVVIPNNRGAFWRKDLQIRFAQMQIFFRQTEVEFSWNFYLFRKCRKIELP